MVGAWAVVGVGDWRVGPRLCFGGVGGFALLARRGCREPLWRAFGVWVVPICGWTPVGRPGRLSWPIVCGGACVCARMCVGGARVPVEHVFDDVGHAN
nr:MAG TPA: hypothetical protein [Caudoviricetes sp.]